MKHSSRIITVVLMACTALFALCLATGCSMAQQSEEQAKAQQANRDFMAQVNVVMGELNDQLAGFSEAVSKEDVVTMKSKAAAAAKTLEKLDKLEAPEAVADLKASYSEGCKELQSALDQYVALYSEIKGATEKHPFDYSKLAERLSKIQKSYQSGYDKLKAADEAAAQK